MLFNLAMMTQVAELDNDRHIKMSIVEFIDGFGRVADKINILVRSFTITNNRILKRMSMMSCRRSKMKLKGRDLSLRRS